MNSKNRRLRRSKKSRAIIAKIGLIRLSVHKSNSHIYAQLIDDKNNIVVQDSESKLGVYNHNYHQYCTSDTGHAII